MKTWAIALAIVIVLVIIIVAVLAYVYSGSEAAVTSVTEGTPVSVGETAAVSNGAPATASTMQTVADETKTVPIVVAGVAAASADDARAAFNKTVAPVVAGVPGQKLADYMFIQGADVNGYDIQRRADLAGKPAELATACSALSGCVSFNHEGYLKRAMIEPSKLSRYRNWVESPTSGIYYLSTATFLSPTAAVSSSAVPAFTFAQGLDMYGYDLPARTDLAGNVSALASACNANADCVGFNTAGYLKKATFTPLYLMPWNIDQAAKGFYYKPSKIIAPSVLVFTNTSGTADSSTVSLGPGSATLSGSAKYIQVPRNMGVILTKGTTSVKLPGFMRGDISAWADGTINVVALQ